MAARIPIARFCIATITITTWLMLPATAADTGQRTNSPAPVSGFAVADPEAGNNHEQHLPAEAWQRGGNDIDGDGHPDYADNCLNVSNPTQLDSDNDGFGNVCDADLDNNLTVNFGDLVQMKQAFLSSPGDATWNPNADMDGSLTVNFGDLILMKQAFLGSPGPSGMSCAGTSPCPAASLTLAWPMPGTDGIDWVIHNYVDLDPGPGIVDYMGGPKSYDGHRGVDIDVPTFRSMDNDFPILASAQGTVLALVESNFDRNTACINNDWNYVTLGHPNGWQTIYGHLKMNSVVVNVGDVVQPGDMLGVVGSSGCSTAPHLHLEVHDQFGGPVAPFANGMIINPPVYDTAFSFMDATLYGTPVTDIDMIKDPPPNVTIVPPGNTLGTGLSMAGGNAGDTINLRIVKGASQVSSFDIVFPETYRHSYWIYNYDFSTAATGDHNLQIRLNGNLVKTYPIYVGPIIGGTQQVRHGVPIASYQQLFSDLVANGFRPIWVDGYDVNGSTFVNAIFDKSSVGTWSAAHGLTTSAYQTYFSDQTGNGLRLVHVDSYLLGGSLRYAAVFTDEPGTAWVAYHFATTAQHQANFNTFIAQGFRPQIISTEQEAGVQRMTALYNKDNVGSWLAQANLTSAQYQTEFSAQTAAGRELAYLNGYLLNGTTRFSAIWTQVGPSTWVARHDLTNAQFQTEFNTWTGAGLTLRFHTGYSSGGVANFGGFWSN